MYAFGDRPPSDKHSHGQKRGRPNEKPIKSKASSHVSVQHPRTTDPVQAAPGMDPPAMSFEARIGLALQGSSWQQLQTAVTEPVGRENDDAVQEDEDIEEIDDDEELDAEMAEDEGEAPKELTEKQKKKLARFTQTIARDAGDIFETIPHDTLTPGPESVVWDDDPELLCCYNWQASTDQTNTIFVPGQPTKWHQPTLPHTLEKDTGIMYADYNYVRQPKDPFAPMFHALKIMNPDYQFNDVDVLAERNSLRVLLEYAQGKFTGPLRLDLYLIFNTLVIVRKESNWWKGNDGKSYGCNFERFFTRPTEGMEDATSHYRAIRYPMGPLSVVCRFEADAYDDGIVSDELSQSEAAAVSGGLTKRPQFTYRAPIRVLQKGHIVPTSQMVELKTQRHDPQNPKTVNCQDQLWFGRTSLLFTGPYEKDTGVIKRIKQEIATSRIKTWEKNQQEPLRKLVDLLSKLRSVLKRERKLNRSAVLVRDSKDGPLTVRAMEGRHFGINKEFFDKHWRQNGSQHDNYRSQRGGGRGTHNAPRGRGQFMPRGGGQFVPRGGSQFTPRGGGQFAPPTGRGQSFASPAYGQFVPSQVYNQFNTPQGGGSSHGPRGGGPHRGRRRSPDHGRGGRGN